MAQALMKPERLTVEEYLGGEVASDVRNEYIDGEIYPLADDGERYGGVALALASALNARLKKPFEVFISDMKLRLRIDRVEMFYYPDVMVTQPPADRLVGWRETPTLIAEVSTKETRRVDFGEKLSAYASIDTLQEYVILARDEPRVTLFRRAAGWRPEHLDGRDTLMLKSVGMTLSVSKIYRNTTSSTD